MLLSLSYTSTCFNCEIHDTGVHHKFTRYNFLQSVLETSQQRELMSGTEAQRMTFRNCCHPLSLSALHVT